MKKRHGLSLCILFISLFYTTISQSRVHEIHQLLRVLKESSRIIREQQRVIRYYVLQALRETPQVKSWDYKEIIEALYQENTYPLLNENITIIKNAINLFEKTEGFLPTLNRFLFNLLSNNINFAKGILYEIEKAVYIVKSNLALPPPEQNNIIAFNRYVLINKLKRQFDLITNTTWYELKNINWGYANVLQETPVTLNLKQQFLDQNKIVNAYNEQNGTSICFMVSSKQAIPDDWKEWLFDQGITFYDETWATA